MATGFLKHSVRERRELILHGSPLRVILLLSLPTVMMAFVSSLIPMTDGLFLNNAGNHIVAASVGYCNPVINMLGALGQGLATAVTAMLGQTYGQGDMNAVRHMSLQVLVFAIVLALGVGPVCVVAGRILSNGLPDQELAAGVFLYLSLHFFILPFHFLAAIFNAIKNATGQPEATLYRMAILLLSKLVFNFLFLSLLGLGVLGAIFATLASYFVISIWMYYDLFVQVSEMRLELSGFRFDWPLLGRLMKLGVPVMLSTALINVGFFLINQEVVTYGTVVFTAQTIAGNINSLTFTIPSSIGTTITTLVSINVAAKQVQRARRSFHIALGVAVGLGLVLTAIFVLLAGPFVSLYLRNPDMDPALRAEIYDFAVGAVNIYTASTIGFALFMAAQGAFIGLGRTRLPLFGGFLRIWLFRYVFILVFREQLGVYAVFYGNLFSNYLSGIIFYIILMRTDWSQGLMDNLKQKRGRLTWRFPAYVRERIGAFRPLPERSESPGTGGKSNPGGKAN